MSGSALMSAFRQDAFNHQIDRMLDDAVRTFGTGGPNWVPSCNVWDDQNGFYVQLALPGWETNQIALEVNSQVLAVKGERKEESGESSRYHLKEIEGSRFVRLFKLPAFVDHEKASAVHKNGLLTISFMKREEAKSRRISIDVQ